MSRRPPLALLAGFIAVFIGSAIAPRDRFTWWLEVAPAIVGVLVLLATYRRFPFTPLAYSLIFAHCVVLLIGGHYTYAEVPLFNWLRDTLGLARNHYDRVGHFAQGFCPAIIAREILLRCSPLRPGRWLFFIAACICLAISAAYELIEWLVAECTGTAATAFLGTQGDVWDTQWDMLLALIGATLSMLLLTRLHDRQVRRIA